LTQVQFDTEKFADNMHALRREIAMLDDMSDGLVAQAVHAVLDRTIKLTAKSIIESDNPEFDPYGFEQEVGLSQ
jgi:hypothetical protein